MTTLLLIIPAVADRIRAAVIRTTSFGTFIVLAALSGVGGGAFASSMSNISFFFPKRMQGLALGLNAGLGNAGVSVMQYLMPWAITFGMFGSLGGASAGISGRWKSRQQTVDSKRGAGVGSRDDRARRRWHGSL